MGTALARVQGVLHLSDASTSRSVLELADRYGADLDSILAKANLEASELERGQPPLDWSRAGLLWRTVADATGRRDMGLLLAESMPIGSYRSLELAAWSAPTIGAALNLIARFASVIAHLPDLDVEEDDDYGAIRIIGPTGIPPELVEFIAAYFLTRCRQGTALGKPVTSVHFRHRPPPDLDVYHRFFGCAVEFGARHTELRFSRDVWDTAPAAADPVTFSHLSTALHQLIASSERSPSYIANLKSHIAHAIRSHDLNMASIARKLGISGRTLQRRLGENNLSFATLVDEVRLDMAKEYLLQPEVPLAEISERLGFSGQAAFQRAFKRWTGTTPNTYRVSHAL